MRAARRRTKQVVDLMRATLHVLILYTLVSVIMGAETCTKAVV
jgi:hypothetical protein